MKDSARRCLTARGKKGRASTAARSPRHRARGGHVVGPRRGRFRRFHRRFRRDLRRRPGTERRLRFRRSVAAVRADPPAEKRDQRRRVVAVAPVAQRSEQTLQVGLERRPPLLAARARRDQRLLHRIREGRQGRQAPYLGKRPGHVPRLGPSFVDGPRVGAAGAVSSDADLVAELVVARRDARHRHIVKRARGVVDHRVRGGHEAAPSLNTPCSACRAVRFGAAARHADGSADGRGELDVRPCNLKVLVLVKDP